MLIVWGYLPFVPDHGDQLYELVEPVGQDVFRQGVELCPLL